MLPSENQPWRAAISHGASPSLRNVLTAMSARIVSAVGSGTFGVEVVIGYPTGWAWYSHIVVNP
ncbi:hypothetical protein U6G28_01875 [Actinomycetaceae bacterium MB13-C1-2]|nr:hypothetical protein U6G28_01875 [Actinomycetaceae bacterium MB13-C1-2]